MKNKFRFNIRLYFTLLVVAVLLFTTVLSSLLVFLLNCLFHASIILPNYIGVILCSIILGGVITTFISQKFFSPITKLSQAMSRVAQGDFSVRLQTKSKVCEIQDIYHNFNLMAQELSATEILQTDFVSNVSHEFKTPLNAIEGYAMLMQGIPQDCPEQREYIDKILLNTKRLSELVGNILLLSKVDNQAIQTKPTRFRLDEQVRQSIVMLEPKWTEKEINFDGDLQETFFTGNEGLLIHVWNNLISNAIKFDPQGGWIRMRMYPKDNKILFTIEDNGSGISYEEQKHIFDKFYQTDSSHQEEGNGLGLALVKQILDSCKGEITVQSQPEKGSKFTVSLPLGDVKNYKL